MSNDNSLNSEDIEPVVPTTTKAKATKTKRQSTAGAPHKNADHGENVRKSVTNTKKRKN